MRSPTLSIRETRGTWWHSSESSRLVDHGRDRGLGDMSGDPAMAGAAMTNRWVANDGVVYLEIHCGCCGMYFVVKLGGSAFCLACIGGSHPDCKIAEIMGIKK